MEQDKRLDRAIARISNTEGNTEGAVCGAGFCVSPGYVMTCAHVVNDALGLDANSRVQPIESVSVVFPLSEKDVGMFQAEVILWHPVDLNKSPQDIAILKLCRQAPQDVESIELGERSGSRFVVKGFPAQSNDGVIAEVYWAGNVGRKLIQLNGVPRNPIAIQSGFSGAPVWDREAQVVVGMIAIANREAEFSQMICASVLRSVLHQLKYAPIQSVLEENRLVLKDVISRAYQYTIPVGWSRSKVPEGISELLEVIDSIPPNDQEPAIVKFLAYICADSRIDRNVVRLLKKWADQQFLEIFTQAIKKAKLQQGGENISLLGSKVRNLTSHLLAVIKPDGENYYFTGLLVTGYDCSQLETPSRSQIHPLESACLLNLDDIPRCIQTCIEKASQKKLSLLSLKIEVFLPLKLMNCCTESWETEVNGFALEIGVEYKLVLRDIGRLEDIYPKRDEWEAKWNYLQQNQDQLANENVLTSGCGDPKNVYSRLAMANILGLKMAEPPPPFGKGHIFAVISRAASPIAIWLRSNSPGIDCETLLDNFLAERIAWHLPAAVKELRNEASQCDNFHIGSHVALIWENPYLLPPSGGDLSDERLGI